MEILLVLFADPANPMLRWSFFSLFLEAFIIPVIHMGLCLYWRYWFYCYSRSSHAWTKECWGYSLLQHATSQRTQKLQSLMIRSFSLGILHVLAILLIAFLLLQSSKMASLNMLPLPGDKILWSLAVLSSPSLWNELMNEYKKCYSSGSSKRHPQKGGDTCDRKESPERSGKRSHSSTPSRGDEPSSHSQMSPSVQNRTPLSPSSLSRSVSQDDAPKKLVGILSGTPLRCCLCIIHKCMIYDAPTIVSRREEGFGRDESVWTLGERRAEEAAEAPWSKDGRR